MILTRIQCSTLRAVCDTFVPAIKTTDDSTGFWARRASDVGADEELATYVSEGVPVNVRNGLIALLNKLSAEGFDTATQEQRETILAKMSSSTPENAQTVSF